jgi:hypothetical protein
MGTSAPCPYCGAGEAAPAERHSDPMRRAVDALYREVALIRSLAETSADQSEEIRMLQETVARLRGSSVAAVHHGPQPGARAPLRTASASLGGQTRGSSAA